MTTPPGAPVTGRSGRRRGKPDTRAEVLRVARQHFARGYAGASIRAIARDAGVDPALVVRFFGTKDQLFIAAVRDLMRPADGLAAALEGPDLGRGRRLASYFLALWEDADTALPLRALVLSAASHPAAAEIYRSFVTAELVGRLATHAAPDQPETRAALAGSQLIGFAFARYIVAIPALAHLDIDKAAAALGDTVDRYLLAPLEL
jgi:AcrR family transcriptional regulator